LLLGELADVANLVFRAPNPEQGFIAHIVRGTPKIHHCDIQGVCVCVCVCVCVREKERREERLMRHVRRDLDQWMQTNAC